MKGKQESSMSVAPNDIRENQHREQNKEQHWHWQKQGTAWKGIGIYHITLSVSNREPLLGTLVIPDNNPTQAYIKRTELGEKVIDCLWSVPKHHPDVRIISFDIMPNHLHTIWHVVRPMPTGIKSVVRGFWQAVKQIGREYSISVAPTDIRENQHSEVTPILSAMPFIRPLSRKNQLDTMIRYTWLNPQRLATMQLMPGFFRIQDNIVIAGRTYKGLGNVELLYKKEYLPVHVRNIWVEAAKHGDDKQLRDYMNGCVLAARNGTILVSPFISENEKAIMEELLKERLPFIYIGDNGFRDYYKPKDVLFDAVAQKQLLILSPWEYDAHKKHVTRTECVEMNKMAEEISNM